MVSEHSNMFLQPSLDLPLWYKGIACLLEAVPTPLLVERINYSQYYRLYSFSKRECFVVSTSRRFNIPHFCHSSLASGACERLTLSMQLVGAVPPLDSSQVMKQSQHIAAHRYVVPPESYAVVSSSQYHVQATRIYRSAAQTNPQT